jgi:hypothetical protein
MSSAPWLTNELLTDLQSCAGRHSADRIRSILERGDPSTLAAWFHVPELKVLIRVLTVKFAAVLPRRIMGGLSLLICNFYKHSEFFKNS